MLQRLRLLIQFYYALPLTLCIGFYLVQRNESTSKQYVFAVQCENTADTLVRHLTKEKQPQRFSKNLRRCRC